MTCVKCGAQIPKGQGRCPNCWSSAPRQGWLERLLRGLGLGASSALRLGTKTTIIRTERIEVTDPQTGQVRVYSSLNEVPVEMREKIEQARHAAEGTAARTKITVTDASGATRTYGSVEEMPAEIRKIYEQVERERTK